LFGSDAILLGTMASMAPPNGSTDSPITEDLLSRALDGLCVGFISVEATGRIAWMNRAAQRLIGLDIEDAKDRPLAKLLRDPQMAAFWQEALATEKTTMAELALHWPTRTDLKANATVSYDTDGELIGRALLFCDVTSERQVQLKLSEEATRRLMDLANNWNESAEAQAGLTAQELRILRLVGQGFSNPHIAGELHIAPSTVRSHLKHVYGKLGIGTRSEAISYALRNGLGG
jgi:DNA-binding CsgD family transcriptional regulator